MIYPQETPALHRYERLNHLIYECRVSVRCYFFRLYPDRQISVWTLEGYKHLRPSEFPSNFTETKFCLQSFPDVIIDCQKVESLLHSTLLVFTLPINQPFQEDMLAILFDRACVFVFVAFHT